MQNQCKIHIWSSQISRIHALSSAFETAVPHTSSWLSTCSSSIMASPSQNTRPNVFFFEPRQQLSFAERQASKGINIESLQKMSTPPKLLHLTIQSKMCLTHPPDPQRLRFLHLTGWVPSIGPALFDAMAPRDESA